MADDEFLASFWGRIIFAFHDARHRQQLQISDDAQQILRELECTEVFSISSQDLGENLPEGPYFVKGTSLHRTWRLFPDISEAFQLPTIHAFRSSR